MSPRLSSDMDMSEIESLIRPGPLQNRDLFQSVHGKKHGWPWPSKSLHLQRGYLCRRDSAWLEDASSRWHHCASKHDVITCTNRRGTSSIDYNMEREKTQQLWIQYHLHVDFDKNFATDWGCCQYLFVWRSFNFGGLIFGLDDFICCQCLWATGK